MCFGYNYWIQLLDTIFEYNDISLYPILCFEYNEISLVPIHCIQNYNLKVFFLLSKACLVVLCCIEVLLQTFKFS